MTSPTSLPSRSRTEAYQNGLVASAALAEGRGHELNGRQVDGEVVEELISEKRIGERIKTLRLKKSMGLVELGRYTGLSASFLSQLETGRVVPTLRNLARIAMVFSKDLSYFFEPEPRTLFRLHRQKDRTRMPQTGVDDPTYFFESLGYLVPDRQLDPYYAEFLPGKAGCEKRAHQHAGCEFLYMLSGALEVQHGEQSYRIEAGDSVYFDATTIHSYACSGDTPAKALIVTLQHPLAAANGIRPAAVAAQQRERIQAATLKPVEEMKREKQVEEMNRDAKPGDRTTPITRRAG